MELKQLYKDAVVLCKTEIPLPDFLLQADVGARSILNRYPKKLVLGQGEYVTPLCLDDPFPLAEAFYTAILYRIAGDLQTAEAEAEAAYKTLWRHAARGKRRKGDTW